MMRASFGFALIIGLLAGSTSLGAEIADGKVIFRLKAPKAREVQLRGQWSKHELALSSDSEGLWQVEVGDVPPGVWEYSFSVDGVNVLDPQNPTLKPQRNPSKSILHLPTMPPAPWDWQDVAHGTLHTHNYQSKALGRQREVVVYTPPGYETSTESLPLLVLQHGSGDNQRTWTEHGKAHWILDHLLAAGKARPMLVLMLDGHPQGMVPRDDVSRRNNSLEAFRRELFDDALPLVEKTYRVRKGPEHRAIAGLSMGGWQSLTVGLTSLDQFAWIGSFSGAADPAALGNALADAEKTNAGLKLLWVGCGREDFLPDRNRTLVASLKDAGVHHEWIMTDGDHSWPVWRGYLADFVPRLFQP